MRLPLTMSSDAVEDEAVADGPKAQPPAEVVAAALEESRLEARLLRVSSSLFLKEAKEYIEGGKVGSHGSDTLPPMPDLTLALIRHHHPDT